MKMFKKVLKYVLSLGVAGVLMYFSFRGVEWENFARGLQSCNWAWIALAAMAGIAAFYLRGLRWRELLLPMDASTSRLTTFNAVNIGNIANFVLPRIGEFVRCGVVSKRAAKDSQLSYNRVLGTVVLERGWDLVSLVIILFVLLCFKWQKFGSFFVHNIWHPIAQRVNPTVGWIILGFVIFIVAIICLVMAFLIKSRILKEFYEIWKGFLKGVLSCFMMKDKWKFFLETALIWLMYWLMSYLTLLALPQLSSLDALDALFLMLAGSLGWVVPVPGGFGAFHFIVATALSSLYGLPFETGIIFATLSHESQAITMTVFGLGSYGCEALRG